LKLVDNATMNKVRAQGDFVYAHAGETPGWEPHYGLETQFRTGGSRNFAGFSDAQIDALIEKEVTTFDANERRAVIRQIVERLIDVYPGTSLGSGSSVVASQPYVTGILGDPTIGSQYETVWLNK
jgi:ABC-type transport system substrate-binding protein